MTRATPMCCLYGDGDFVTRDKAVVSVFVPASCWAMASGMGLRLVRGRLLSLDAPMDRLLFQGANAIAMDLREREQVVPPSAPPWTATA